MKYISLFFFLACAIAASAIESTPGALKSLVSDPATTTSLTVTGSIDASDLQFIADDMPALRSLDLSGATIVKCRDSQTIYPDNTIPASIFAGSRLTSVTLPTAPGLIIENTAFAGSGLTSVAIPANVKSVGFGAFAGCSDLAQVTLNGTTTFADHVFRSCPSLASVDLAGTKTVTDGMFNNCPLLATVSGSSSLTTIGTEAFTGDAALQQFDFPSTLSSIGDDAFAHTGLSEALLANTALRSIGARAFAGDVALTEVTLPSTLSSLGEGAFAGCATLVQIVLPDAVSVIPEYAFLSASAMDTQNALTPNLTEIGAYAFKGHSSQTNIGLPSTLEYIGDNAMEGMTGLQEIHAETLTSVPELGKDVWKGIDQSEVKLHASQEMTSAFQGATQWQDFSIQPPFVGIEDAIAESTTSVRARFVGSDLQIVVTDTEIAEFSVFEPSGALLCSGRPNTEAVTVDTSAWTGNIFIVNVKLACGKTATAKLIRL